jgi:hypothetical protein
LPTFAFSTPASFVFASFEKNFESLQKLYVALKKSKRSRGKLIFVVARETQTKKNPKFATLNENISDPFSSAKRRRTPTALNRAQKKKARGRK